MTCSISLDHNIKGHYNMSLKINVKDSTNENYLSIEINFELFEK